MTAADLELLTAAIDGELSSDQDARFRRLLAESADAAAMYRRLLRDREALRRLPAKSAPAKVLPEVMSRVAPMTTARPVRNRRAWVPVALAASLLAAITVGSFSVFQPAGERRASAVATNSTPTVPVETLPAVASTPAAIPAPASVPAVVPPAAVVRLPLPSPREVIPAPTGLLTSPVEPDPKAFDTVELRLPLLLPMTDLTSADGRSRLSREIARDSFTRIDLFVTDTAKAADSLTAAGKLIHLSVVPDALALERKRKAIPSAWAIVVDGLTPAEIAQWLAATDASVIRTAHILGNGPADAKEWKELLGVDPSWAKKPRTTESAPRSVASGTADQVAGNLVKSAERHGLLLTYLPPNARVNPLFSREVRQFLERKIERRPDAVPLLVVVRSTNS